MQALKHIFQDQLTAAPKSKKEKQKSGYGSHAGWTFIAKKANGRPVEQKAVRTYQTLFSATKEYTYFTPNTFYHNKKRDQNSLRWINAFSVDLDVKGQSIKHIALHDLIFHIVSVGLPKPSLVVKTPSGGCHVHWYLEDPRRAYKKSLIEHYKRITRVIIEELECFGADFKADSPERYYRVPTEDNIIYQSGDRSAFKTFADWYSSQVEKRQEKKGKFDACLRPGQSLLQHAAVKKLLQGVEEGQRDHTCYTLALAFKASGYDEKETEERLHAWNERNNPPMRQIDIKRKVKSAFKKGSPAGASSEWISRLSGIRFTYQVWEEAKPRHERVYSHLSEWEEDILAYIRQRKNGQVMGSQRDICEDITSSANRKTKISYATFKRAIASLIESGKLHKAVSGKGRGAVTTLTIQEQVKPLRTPEKASGTKKKQPQSVNGFNSNTPMAPVVGGSALALPVSLPVSTRPVVTSRIPSNVPDSFVSALWMRGFRDGRFIFGAWGKIQLAFKAFDISFSAIKHSSDYLKLASEAVGITAAAKGSNLSGEFSNTDGFYKYLYGTAKKLLAEYRETDLTDFIRAIDGLNKIALLSIGSDLEEELKTGSDKKLIQDKLNELDLELSALSRRNKLRNSKDQEQPILLFNWIEN